MAFYETRTLNWWQKIRLALLHSVFFTLSLLPLCVLYLLSDFCYLLVYRLARYRRRIVRQNLSSAFPEKSEKERRNIERRFYHWLCDYFIETIKLTSMSKKTMRNHMRFENNELLQRLVDEGKSVILLLGHYGNWEWISSIPLHIHKDPSTWGRYQIYHPIENAVLNKMFLHIRGRMGVENVPMNETLRVLVHTKQAGRPSVTGFIADQAPRWLDIRLWAPFLNHPETPFFIGPERIAKKLDFAVVYLDVRRERRGYYVATYRMMTEHPKEYKDYELTEWYARLLDETIRRQPEFWLWTHNRWKRTKEQYDRIKDPVTGKLWLHLLDTPS